MRFFLKLAVIVDTIWIQTMVDKNSRFSRNFTDKEIKNFFGIDDAALVEMINGLEAVEFID